MWVLAQQHLKDTYSYVNVNPKETWFSESPNESCSYLVVPPENILMPKKAPQNRVFVEKE